MDKNSSAVKSVTGFIIPYLLIYGIYIQIGGEDSPGGGFQAGVIFACAIIAFDLAKNPAKLLFSVETLISSASLGVFLYASVGLVSFFRGNEYLSYYSIASDPLKAQKLGIFLIEVGVGLTVSSTSLLLYYAFRNIEKNSP